MGCTQFNEIKAGLNTNGFKKTITIVKMSKARARKKETTNAMANLENAVQDVSSGMGGGVANGKVKTSGGDTNWDNPMVRAAMEALSPEDLQRYKEFGEYMYGTTDFARSKALGNIPPPMAESIAYIEAGLRSGLHISDLDDDERAVLQEAFGEEWFTRYGFSKEDLSGV